MPDYNKKRDKTNIDNYQPISILPTLSKIYERCMYGQIYSYFNSFFSKYQRGFCQGHSSQNWLVPMLEKWRACVDECQICGTILHGLSKSLIVTA